MKKIFLIISALTVAASMTLSASASDISADGIYENEAEELASQQPVTYSLSLEEAINMAYENNAQILANDANRRGCEVSIKSAEISYLRNKKTPVNISSNFELFCLKKGYYLEAAKTSLTLAEKEGEKIKANIAYNVTETYYNYGLMQKLVNAAQNSYNLALRNKELVDAQYNMGIVSQLDYENASITVESCLNALNSYKLKLDILQSNLKILLNKDSENCIIEVTDEIGCEDFTGDPKVDAESAVESRYDLTALKEKRALSEQYFELSKSLTEASAVYNQAYADFVEADYNYTNSCKLISLSIQSSYNDVVTSKANLETGRKTYEMKLKEYNSSVLKYELGMISNIEITDAINNLYNAQVEYANAKLSYRMAVEKYQYEITIGL